MGGIVSQDNWIWLEKGSEARSNGNDCMFLVCSERCGKKLKRVLEKEISLGKMFETVHLRRKK